MTRKGRLRLQRRKRQVGNEAEENSESNSEMSGTEDESGKLDRIEEEDEVASNTAEAEAVVNLAEVAEVESNLPAEVEDNTVKVE
jgi:hypothetical protein